MLTPRLSVGLPVFNGERFLAASIESVLRQDFSDFELIISDNASTDRTPEIGARYAAADARVRFVRSETNRGGAWNFNHVFAQSRAPFFKWQAHDDVCLPGCFRRCLETFEHAPSSVAVVFPRTGFIDEHERRLPDFPPEPMATRRRRPHERLGDVLRTMTMVRAQFGVIRSPMLRQTRLFAPMIAADFVLFAELALLGDLWELPETLFLRRIHAGISTRANRGSDQLIQWWDPSQKKYRSRIPPMLRLGREYIRSILRLPLPAAERARCIATVLRVWYVRELRNLGGRWLAGLRHPSGPRPVATVPPSS